MGRIRHVAPRGQGSRLPSGSTVSITRPPRVLRFVVPTASKGLVKTDHRQELVPLRAGQVELGWEKLLLCLQNLVIIGLAGHIPLGGKSNCSFQGRYFTSLVLSNLSQLKPRDQGVRNLTKGVQHRLAVSELRFASGRFGLAVLFH